MQSTIRAQANSPRQEMVPALTDTIKGAGLVLVADTSNESRDPGLVGEEWSPMPDGVNGVMKRNGILKFNETIDM